MRDEEAIIALAALAQDTRLAIVQLLMRRGALGMAAGGIAERLNVPASVMSFHLHQLTNANLIKRTRRSRSLIYSIRPDQMQSLLTYLSKNCCVGGLETRR